MSKNNSNDLISISDVVQRIPNLTKKLPRILSGLRHAYLHKTSSNVGMAWAFEQATIKNSNGYALYYEDQKYTYTELNAWANQIAHYFLSIGAKKGDVIAVMLENRPELLATVLGLAKIGVVSALINTAQNGKALAHSIALVQPIALIAGQETDHAILNIYRELNMQTNQFYWFADQYSPEKEKMSYPFQNLRNLSQEFAQFNPATSQHIHGKDGLFYLYTSGTTGLPKAVIFTNSRWMLAYGTYGHVLDLHRNDVMYATLPFYHATGMVVCWCGVIAGQATLAIRRKFSRSAFWHDVEKFNATAIGYVGELCRYLLDAAPSPQHRNHNVKKMIGNGMRPNIWKPFKQRFGINEVLELYASSEGNVGFSNIFNFDNTVGFSPTPYSIIAFDKETNQPIRNKQGLCQSVTKGEIGLLVGKITNRSPFDGYSNAEDNHRVILNHVLKKGDRYFNTGDLVRHLGFRHVQFVDRLGDTFRWKGENVSTTEVENVALNYTKITEAVAYGVEIPHTNGRAGMLALTVKDHTQLDHQDLINLLLLFKTELPNYAIPLFLRVQKNMETTGTFKYPKNKLKEQAFDPNLSQDQLYVLLPSTEQYIVLDQTIYEKIQQSEYRF